MNLTAFPDDDAWSSDQVSVQSPQSYYVATWRPLPVFNFRPYSHSCRNRYSQSSRSALSVSALIVPPFLEPPRLSACVVASGGQDRPSYALDPGEALRGCELGLAAVRGWAGRLKRAATMGEERWPPPVHRRGGPADNEAPAGAPDVALELYPQVLLSLAASLAHSCVSGTVSPALAAALHALFPWACSIRCERVRPPRRCAFASVPSRRPGSYAATSSWIAARSSSKPSASSSMAGASCSRAACDHALPALPLFYARLCSVQVTPRHGYTIAVHPLHVRGPCTASGLYGVKSLAGLCHEAKAPLCSTRYVDFLGQGVPGDLWSPTSKGGPGGN